MVEKLISLGKSPRLALILKAVIFGLILRWLGNGGAGGLWPAFSFVALATFFYFRPLFNTLALLRSFSVFLLLGIFTPKILLTYAGDPLMNSLSGLLYLWPFWAALSLYLILGLKDLIFVHRKLAHLGLFSMFFYQTVFGYFAPPFRGGLFYGLILLSLASLIFSELIAGESRATASQAGAAAAVFGWLVFGGFFVATALPLGFFKAANFVALGGFFAAELALYFYNGALGRSVLYPRLLIFGLLALAILLTLRWHL